MLRHLLFCLSLSVACFALSPSAHASFACGPHLYTYIVHSTNGAVGEGVRCVKFESIREKKLSWYGEGYWGDDNYRHVGAVAWDDNAYQFRTYAADIFGNGENTNGTFDNLEFDYGTYSIPGRPPVVPALITVSGGWSEQWFLARDGEHPTYVSRVGAVSECGDNFIEYKVHAYLPNHPYTPNPNRPGAGVRCQLPRLFPEVWYGEGEWSGNRYSHLGSARADGEAGQQAGLSDICDESRGVFCNRFDYGSIRFLDYSVSNANPYRYVAGLDEVWVWVKDTPRRMPW